MNERIRQLAEQAGYTKDMFGIGHWEMPECKKFVELIVMECLDKISGLVIPEEDILPVDSYEQWNQALGHAVLEIEQHFHV